jgi:hypothetical protein
MEDICIKAGIQSRFLRGTMTDHCSAGELDWVKKFRIYRAEGVPGLLLNGVGHPDSRCQAIAGALVRNYIDARVIPVNTLLDLAAEGMTPSPTVLLIPNLYMSSVSKTMPAWKVQQLYDILLQRSTHGKPTVVYVEDLKSLAGQYGVPFHDFLEGFKAVQE